MIGGLCAMFIYSSMTSNIILAPSLKLLRKASNSRGFLSISIYILSYTITDQQLGVINDLFKRIFITICIPKVKVRKDICIYKIKQIF